MVIPKKWRSKINLIYFILFLLGIFLGTETRSVTSTKKLPDIWSLSYDETYEKLRENGNKIILADNNSLLVVYSNAASEEKKAYLFSAGQLCSVDTYKESTETRSSWEIMVHELEKNGSPLKTIALEVKGFRGYGLVWQKGPKTETLQSFSFQQTPNRDDHNPVYFVTLKTVVDTAVCPNYRFPEWVPDNR